MRERINSKLHYRNQDSALLKQRKIRKKFRKYTRPLDSRGFMSERIGNIREFDPSYMFFKDFKDNKGQITKKALTEVNPLKTKSLDYTLFFIDGNNECQIIWILEHIKNIDQSYRLILVKGSRLELMEKYKVRFYLDEQAVISKSFNIVKFPTIIKQKGLKLQIEEIVL